MSEGILILLYGVPKFLDFWHVKLFVGLIFSVVSSQVFSGCQIIGEEGKGIGSITLLLEPLDLRFLLFAQIADCGTVNG